MTITDLLSVQAGKETVWATSVTPTVKLMGIEDFTITPIVESEVKKDLRGSQAPGYNAVVNKVDAQADFSGQLLYDDIPYWNEGLMGVVAPSGGGPYVRANVAPTTNAGVTSPRMQTIIKGDATDAYKLAGGILTELTISGEAGKASMIKGKMLGQQVTSGAALAGLSDRVVSLVMGDHWTLYIDAAGGTIGATAIAATGFSFELNIKTNRKARHFLGALTPGNWNDPRWTTSLKITAEFNTVSKAYLNLLLTNAVLEHQVRLKATTGASAIVQYDFAGVLNPSPKVYDGANDEDVTIDLNYDGKYNTALGNYLKSSVTNNVATLV